METIYNKHFCEGMNIPLLGSRQWGFTDFGCNDFPFRAILERQECKLHSHQKDKWFPTMIQMILSQIGMDTAYNEDDIKKLEKYYLQFQKPLYYFILQMVREEDAVNDILQESFANILKARPEVRSDNDFRNYLFTVALNLCRGRARSFALRSFTSIQGMEEMGGQISDDSMPFEEKVELSQFEDILRGYIDQLPDKERSVLLMKKVDGMTYDDIHKITGISTRTLKRIVKRSLEKVLSTMEDAGLFIEGGTT